MSSKMVVKQIFILVLLCFCQLWVLAQNELVSATKGEKTESAISVEEKFSDAQREMLVGKLDKAIALYEELYKADRNNGAVSFELVKAYAQKKDFFQVEKYAKSALENTKGNQWVMEYIAAYMMDNSRPGTAFEIYTQLILQQPQQFTYYDKAAECLLKQDKWQEAANLYQTAELKIGKQAAINFKKFEIYDSHGQEALAMAELESLITRYPEDTEYLKVKARSLTKKNRIDEAMQVYKKVLAINPEDTDANLAVLSKGSKEEKPSAYLMSLLPIITNQSIAIDVKIKELIPYVQQLGKHDDNTAKLALLDLCDKLVLTHPDDARAYSLHGDALFFTGDMDNAIVKYEKTLQLNNKNFAVWEQLMYAYLETQKMEALSIYSNKAIDLYPNQAINYYFAALSANHLKNHDEAISLCDEGMIVSGGNKISASKIQTALATALCSKKQWDKALEAADKALTLSDQRNVQACEVMGDIYLAKGEIGSAKEWWKKALEKGSKSKTLMVKLQS